MTARVVVFDPKRSVDFDAFTVAIPAHVTPENLAEYLRTLRTEMDHRNNTLTSTDT